MSRSFDSMSLTTLPSMAIVPPEISSRPASMRNSVDLPHPDGPTSTMNSPSWMSKPMPWMTLVLPKVFSMFWNDTDAISAHSQCLTARLFPISSLHRAGGKPSDHVPLERVIDRRRRDRVDEADGHQELPWRILRGEGGAEAHGQRAPPVNGKKAGTGRQL